MTIRLDFVNVNREVTGSLEFRVGGSAQSSADGIAPCGIRRSGQMKGHGAKFGRKEGGSNRCTALVQKR
jgi:hypothetical protein